MMTDLNNEPIARLKRKYALVFDGQAMQSLVKRCAACGFEEKVRDAHTKDYGQALAVVFFLKAS